jgi:hypothetical protein
LSQSSRNATRIARRCRNCRHLFAKGGEICLFLFSAALKGFDTGDLNEAKALLKALAA